MLAKRIIPCLDVKEGRVVKGTGFLDLKDAGDPVACAQRYDREGADELVFLDITASFEKRSIMLEVVRRTAEKVFMPLTVGGGVRTVSDVRTLLEAGADKVSINTAAVEDPRLVKKCAARFGSQCVVVAIDAKRDPSKKNAWRVYTHGGRRLTKWDATRWARTVERLGAGEILLTSMDRDGSKEGFDLDLLKKVSSSVRIPVIASGGVGTLEHLYEGLTRGRADAALAASIFHYGRFTIRQAKDYLRKKGVRIR